MPNSLRRFPINLRDLTYLVAVAQHQHFGKAAQHCFVSQPALSMQLKKLEEELGVTLFERTHKKVVVTEVGERILKRAQEILRITNEMKEIAATFHNPFAGHLWVGAFPTLAPYFFPQVVSRLKASYTQLIPMLVEEKTEILIQKLKDGQIDAAFLATPLPSEDESLSYQELFRDLFYVAVPSNHALAKQRHVTNDDLRSQRLLLLEDGHCLRDQALEVCSLTGANESEEFRGTSLETLRQMVIAGVGITLIPEIAVRDEPDICYLPFKGDNAPYRTISLVWRNSSARKNSLREIADLFCHNNNPS